MRVVILDNKNEVAEYGANIFIEQLQTKTKSVLGLATGSTPVALYQNLINAFQQQQITFKDAITFNLDEYLGLHGSHPQSYRYFMNNTLFKYIDIDINQTYIPDGDTKDPIATCYDYENKIKSVGGIDIQLLGIGRNGHIGFNEPSSGLMSRTRVKTLTQETIHDNARFFDKDEYQPHLSLTMGTGTILDSRKVVLLAIGKEKSEAIANTIEGPLTASCPASALQLHKNAIIVIDKEAASKLKNVNFYKHVEKEQQHLINNL